jgi:hypothetical protein
MQEGKNNDLRYSHYRYISEIKASDANPDVFNGNMVKVHILKTNSKYTVYLKYVR